MKRTMLCSVLVIISFITTNVYAYDIAVKNADSVTIYYNYINDGHELEVTNGVSAMFNDNRTDYSGSPLITELQDSSNEFVIQDGIENGFSPSRISTAIANNPEMQGLSAYLLGSNGSGGTITWNPTINQGGMQNNHSSKRPSFLGLGHELFHALDANRGNLYLTNNEKDIITGKVYKARYKGLDKTEWRACYGENLIRKELGLPLRKYYNTGDDWGPELISPLGIPLNYP